jgi:hypothetical protein
MRYPHFKAQMGSSGLFWERFISHLKVGHLSLVCFTASASHHLMTFCMIFVVECAELIEVVLSVNETVLRFSVYAGILRCTGKSHFKDYQRP